MDKKEFYSVSTLTLVVNQLYCKMRNRSHDDYILYDYFLAAAAHAH